MPLDALEAADVRRRGPAISPTTVLVVEDDRSQLSALLAALTARGYRAIGVESGAEALEAISDGHVDVIMLDLGRLTTTASTSAVDCECGRSARSLSSPPIISRNGWSKHSTAEPTTTS